MLMLMTVGIAVALVLRPGSPEPASPGASPTPTRTVSPSTPAKAPGERAFCAGFEALAQAQASYADEPDARGPALEDAASRLVGIGVPASMPAAARGGYYTLLDGIYSSLGKALDPTAVSGAAQAGQLPDSGTAFSAYLGQACPP